MDKVLHPERVAGRGANRYKPTFTTTFGSIPDGVMFHVGEGGQAALLKWNGRVWFWKPEGYGERPVLGQGLRVDLLIPKTVMEVIRAGKVPGVRESVGG